MSNVFSQMKTSAWFWGLYTVFALLLVCYVPTLVGSKFVASDSYVFGYNNRVGVLLVLLLTILAARISPGPAPRMSSDSASDTVRPLTLWLCASLIVAAAIALAFLTSHLGSFGESAYLINRIELTSRGLHPYRDFEFSYGVLFLYAPLALARIFKISIPNSYYFFWVIVLLVGTWLLAQVISRLDLPGRHRNSIFLMIFLFSFVSILSTGLNYTSLRFASGPFLAISIFEIIRHPGRKREIFGSLLAVFYTLILLSISPEIAVAYAFGVSAFMFLLYIPSTRKIWAVPYLGMLVLIVVLFMEADRLHAFDTLKSFGNGGFNFPIIPSPSILFFLFALFMSARQVLAAFAQPQLRSNSLCVLFISLPMIVSALGRCDPGHVLWGGLTFILVGFLWSSCSVIAWRYYSAAFIIIFLVAGSLSAIWLYRGELGRAAVVAALSSSNKQSRFSGAATQFLIRHFGKDDSKNKIAKLRLLAQYDASSDELQLTPGLQGIGMAPFGYNVSHNPTSLDFGHYWGAENALNPQAVDRKISELQADPERQLLLPEHWQANCTIIPDQSIQLIRSLFVYPYRARAVHAQSIYEPLCRYILSHYVLALGPGAATYDYEVWSSGT